MTPTQNLEAWPSFNAAWRVIRHQRSAGIKITFLVELKFQYFASKELKQLAKVSHHR